MALDISGFTVLRKGSQACGGKKRQKNKQSVLLDFYKSASSIGSGFADVNGLKAINYACRIVILFGF